MIIVNNKFRKCRPLSGCHGIQKENFYNYCLSRYAKYSVSFELMPVYMYVEVNILNLTWSRSIIILYDHFVEIFEREPQPSGSSSVSVFGKGLYFPSIYVVIFNLVSVTLHVVEIKETFF